MDNQQLPPAQDPTQPPFQTPAPAVIQPQANIHKKSPKKMMLIGGVVVLFILAVGGVYYWQHQQVVKLQKQVTDLNSQVAKLNDQVKMLSESSDNSDDSAPSSAEIHNEQRQADVNTILNATYQYSIDNDGKIPTGIMMTPTHICATGAASCTGLVNLSILTTNGKYLVTIPKDPKTGTSTDTHYQISIDANNRVTVSAPDAESGKTISVTR